MKILEVESGPVATIGYLAYDEETKDAIIIDVPLESCDRFVSLIDTNGLNLMSILLTHTHWDHTADCPKLRDVTKAPVYVTPQDEFRIISPMENTIWKLPFTLEPMNADMYMKDNEILSFGSIRVEVRLTPGHTEGGACFVIHNSKIVFSGDTLFNMSIGRIDLPGGDYEQIMKSIMNKLLTLPDDYRVLSGHGEPTLIGFERRNNPFIIEYLNNDL